VDERGHELALLRREVVAGAFRSERDEADGLLLDDHGQGQRESVLAERCGHVVAALHVAHRPIGEGYLLAFREVRQPACDGEAVGLLLGVVEQGSGARHQQLAHGRQQEAASTKSRSSEALRSRIVPWSACRSNFASRVPGSAFRVLESAFFVRGFAFHVLGFGLATRDPKATRVFESTNTAFTGSWIVHSRIHLHVLCIPGGRSFTNIQ
jgi:hypothetical protein